MSIVRNGKVSSNDQKVDRDKFGKNHDDIDFSNAPWRKKDKSAKSTKKNRV